MKWKKRTRRAAARRRTRTRRRRTAKTKKKEQLASQKVTNGRQIYKKKRNDIAAVENCSFIIDGGGCRFPVFCPSPGSVRPAARNGPGKKKNKTKLFVVNNSTLEPEGLNQNRQDLEMRTTIARMKPLDEIKVGGNPSATKSVTR